MSNGRDAKPGGCARTHLVTSDLICPLELAGRWVAELAVHSALEDLEVLVEPTAALEERGAHGRDVDHSATRTRVFTVGEVSGVFRYHDTAVDAKGEWSFSCLS
jgi:hypothetical protein